MVFQSTLPARGATPFREANELDVLTFQSTLPARGATNLKLGYGGTQKISIHAPRTGSNRTSSSIFPGRPHFNPRSPHGERRFSRFLPRFAVIISIHAPRTGSDHPALRRASESLPISIHAPRTGSDGSRGTQRPRVPISIHAPRTGSDCGGSGFLARVELISIHAPRTGSDTACWATAPSRSNFNPRSPHGERPWEPPGVRPAIYFNPRSPHGERHSANNTSSGSTKISTHAPRTGSDQFAHFVGREAISFQPTLPARGATCRRIRCARNVCDFNPRSPHGERPDARTLGRRERPFQPTLPARGATPRESCARRIRSISTHAPRTGSDAKGRKRPRKRRFQPTLPARGATKPAVAGRGKPQNFNPRSPHGERPGLTGIML